MDETTYEDEQGLSNSSEMRGTGRREFIAALEEKMSYPTSSIDIDRDIGNFFYDLKPARDAGVGLTEQTIDYIADVKGEPEWIRAFRKNAYRVFKSKPLPTHWAGDEREFLRANGSSSLESKLSLIARRSILTSKRRFRIRV